MGGFQLYQRAPPGEELLKQEEGEVVRYSINPGKFVRILEMADVRSTNSRPLYTPCTTEGDLKDRGKSDGIAKAIVMFQTSWFVVQCIARGFRQLPLTELEIVTLAYAMMNSFIYFFWWDKPRDVGCPIRVYENVAASYTPVKWARGFSGIFQRMLMYIIGSQDQFVPLSTQRKVPIFWFSTYGNGHPVTGIDENPTITGALLGPPNLGIAFGAIHFIAWWHEFPSHAESVLWRMSCIALVVVPLLSAIACGLLRNSSDSTLLTMITVIPVMLLMLSAWLCIVARAATIVIAFTALRSLPSDALLAVDWTTFIPHI